MLGVPEGFLQANASICLMLGCMFNCPLLWLLWKRTNEKMVNYRPILLLRTIIDLVNLVAYAVVVPTWILDNSSSTGATIWFSIGPLGWLPQPYNFALIGTCMLCWCFSLFSLPVPFVFRYLNVCRRMRCGVRAYLTMLLAPLLAAVFEVALYTISASYASTEAVQHRGWELFFSPNNASVTSNVNVDGGDEDDGEESAHYTVSWFIAAHSSSGPIPLYFFSSVLVVYTLGFCFGWRTYSHLAGTGGGHPSREEYRILQLQLESALIFQALLSFVALFIPSTTLAIVPRYFPGIDTKGISVYIASLFIWVPVLNPLLAIWAVKAYRRVLGEWFGQLKSRSNPATNTVEALQQQYDHHHSPFKDPPRRMTLPIHNGLA